MKKLLFLFSALLFISCSEDENEGSNLTFFEKYDGVVLGRGNGIRLLK